MFQHLLKYQHFKNVSTLSGRLIHWSCNFFLYQSLIFHSLPSLFSSNDMLHHYNYTIIGVYKHHNSLVSSLHLPYPPGGGKNHPGSHSPFLCMHPKQLNIARQIQINDQKNGFTFNSYSHIRNRISTAQQFYSFP